MTTLDLEHYATDLLKDMGVEKADLKRYRSGWSCKWILWCLLITSLVATSVILTYFFSGYITGFSLSVFVMTSTEKSAISDASVVISQDNKTIESRPTDENGHVTFQRIGRGSLDIYVSADNFNTLKTKVSLTSDDTVFIELDSL
ncbi:hypothetical protein P9112_002629 [Eukaryota sp. TZLM1-RC]